MAGLHVCVPHEGIVAILGCVNDTEVMKTFLLSQGFKEENIRILTDDPAGKSGIPTRENMINSLKWLIHDAKKNDS